MIKVAICEPKNEIASHIENIVIKAQTFLPEKFETDVYNSGDDLFNGLDQGEEYQIVFISLDLGDMSGFEAAKQLRLKFSERDTLIIFLSKTAAIDENIFDVMPYAFVRLPFDEKALMQRIFLAVEHLQKSDDLFIVKQGRTTFQVKKKDIICLESIGRDIVLSSMNREDIRYREALKNEYEKLMTINFIRPHNSFVINLDHVEQYHTDSLTLSGGRNVPISELRMREVKKSILKFWEYRNISVT